jgi:hypothetical protein
MLPIQQRFLEWGLDDPDHYVIPVLLKLDGDFSLERLQASLVRLLDETGVFLSRIQRQGRDAFLERLGMRPPTVNDLKLYHRGAGESLNSVFHTLRQQIGVESRLGLISLICPPGAVRPSHLMLLLHHLVCDGYSIKALVDRLAELYHSADDASMRHSQSLDLWQHARLLERWANTEGAELAVSRLLALPWTAVAPLKGIEPGLAELSEVLTLDHWVPHSITRGLTAGVRTERSGRLHSEEVVVLAAVARALAEVTGSTTQLVDVCRGGRVSPVSMADVERTVGWLAVVCPHVLVVPTSQSPESQLDDLALQVAGIRAVEMSYGAVRWMSRNADLRDRVTLLPRPQVYFNYRGVDMTQPPVAAPFAWVGESLGPLQTTRGRQQYEVKVWGDVIEGRLRLRWAFVDAGSTSQTVKRVAELTDRFIRTTVKGG